jgi:hypothetical protein
MQNILDIRRKQSSLLRGSQIGRYHSWALNRYFITRYRYSLLITRYRYFVTSNFVLKLTSNDVMSNNVVLYIYCQSNLIAILLRPVSTSNE